MVVRTVAAGGNDEIGLFFTRSPRQLHQVLGALALPDIESNALPAEDFERAFE
jgi:hypothetical protein